MSTAPTLGPSSPAPARAGRRWRLDRTLVGVLLVAGGVAWLLDAAGVSVPWRLFPPAALVLTGAALLIAAVGGWSRHGLVGLGAVLLVAAVAVGVDVERFAGPVGDEVVAPTSGQWPAEVRRAAGTVTVDLTRHPLPPSGRLDVSVGAGRVVLVLPRMAAVRADVEVVTGAVVADGVRVDDGIQARWTEPSWAEPSVAPVEVAVDVALGEVEVLHEQ